MRSKTQNGKTRAPCSGRRAQLAALLAQLTASPKAFRRSHCPDSAPPTVLARLGDTKASEAKQRHRESPRSRISAVRPLKGSFLKSFEI